MIFDDQPRRDVANDNKLRPAARWHPPRSAARRAITAPLDPAPHTTKS
jgi:hypothetical protein